MKKSKIYELKNILTNGINEISDYKEGKKVLNAILIFEYDKHIEKPSFFKMLYLSFY